MNGIRILSHLPRRGHPWPASTRQRASDRRVTVSRIPGAPSHRAAGLGTQGLRAAPASRLRPAPAALPPLPTGDVTG